ncbi:DCC1-like thiol-disulfide oxidoreductase family protein [Dactylosporangium sp. NPDC005555]|uniref:thiol-disulfide oxidoreductase DCC family protein n=1 Tax=Dactylosporangium sp. NPDC005555 TaxID=3154889 RepID=UPI0033ABA4F2
MNRPTFVFDGDCAFCSSCARFIERRIRPTAHVVAWQFTDLDALGVTQEAASVAVQYVTAGRAPTAGPVAIADMLRDVPGAAGRFLWRPIGTVLGLRPVAAMAWPVYRWIARNRHRMPGGTAACALPPGHPARAGN